jgi:NTE family protein
MLLELVTRGVVPDRVYGTSAGAINGAAVASDPTPEAMEKLCDVWRGLSREHIFPGSRAMTLIRAVQRRHSLFPSSGLRNVIVAGIGFENIEDSPIPFEVIATSLDTGTECRITSGPVVEALLASAAVPGIFPPVRIGDELMIDGGVVNIVPISQAVADGANEVYVLLTGDIQPRPAATLRPLEAVFGALSIAVHTRFPLELAEFRRTRPDVKIFVIAVESEVRSAYNAFSATEKLIADGRRSAATVLDDAGVPPLT